MKFKFFKYLKIYLSLITIIVIGVLLILNEYILYGIILCGIAFLFFALWRIFFKKKEEEILKLTSRLEESLQQNDSLQKENNELRNRKLNIAKIKNILDLGLMEIDTNFTRTWNEKRKLGKKTLHFFGALQVKINAKYGINLKELRIKFDKDNNDVTVANIIPKFLSFQELDYDWKIAEIMEYKKPLFDSNHWGKSDKLEVICGQLKEDYQKKTHQEVKNGPEELNWIIDPLKKRIENTLELIIGSPERNIIIVDSFDDTFQTLDEFKDDNEGKLIE